MRTYKVNEIFYSIQGEGSGTGEAAVFVRFFGCNRACPFCDTEQKGFEQLTVAEIIERANDVLKEANIAENPSQGLRIVLTGGEPTLQIDEALVYTLSDAFNPRPKIQIETNGTMLSRLPENLLSQVFLTISPKTLEDALRVAEWLKGPFLLTCCKGAEVKIVSSPLFAQDDDLSKTLAIFKDVPVSVSCFLQPLDAGNKEKNTEEVQKCIRVIKSSPKWRLSLQTHKIIGIR